MGKAGLRLGQAEEKLKHEKFSGTTRAGVLPARCLRGKVLFNFVWFDVKLASCHFHPVFFVGRVCCLAPCCSEQYLYYPDFLVNAHRNTLPPDSATSASTNSKERTKCILKIITTFIIVLFFILCKFYFSHGIIPPNQFPYSYNKFFTSTVIEYCYEQHPRKCSFRISRDILIYIQ